MYYLGQIKVYSYPTQKPLLTAIQQEYGSKELTALACEIKFTHFKSADDLLWQDCCERDITIIDEQEHPIIYNSIWAEMVFPFLSTDDGSFIYLDKERVMPICLDKKYPEVVFYIENELEVKVLRNGQPLRSFTPPRRKLHGLTLSNSSLVSLRYL